MVLVGEDGGGRVGGTTVGDRGDNGGWVGALAESGVRRGDENGEASCVMAEWGRRQV